MSNTQLSAGHLGKDITCQLCKAGGTASFNWQYVQKNDDFDLPRDKSIYINHLPLKSGTLFECKACGTHWYLDSEEHFMNHVKESKIQLIHEWSSSVILFTEAQKSILGQIGSTLLHGYYGSQSNETPCSVKTKSGEVLDLSIITIQKHAPFEDWRSYRLASEIEEITPSQYALPLKVRKATSQAGEIRMGFAPTLVSLSNNQELILHWGQTFLKKTGVKANETKVCKRRINLSNMPEVYSLNEEVVYFIADPENAELSPSNDMFNTATKKLSLFRRFSQLFGAG
jgi:hypothetical protein